MTTETKSEMVPLRLEGDYNLMSMSKDQYERAKNVASLYAMTDFAPKGYRGNQGNCLIAMVMAHRLDVDPVMFMQKTYPVHGKIAMETQMAIALAERSEAFRGPIRYEFNGAGDKRSCTAWAIFDKDGERVDWTISVETAKKAGWYSKNENWKNLTDEMLSYRAAMYLIRRYASKALMGMYSMDELQDTEPEAFDPGKLNPVEITITEAKGESESTIGPIQEIEEILQNLWPMSEEHREAVCEALTGHKTPETAPEEKLGESLGSFRALSLDDSEAIQAMEYDGLLNSVKAYLFEERGL